MNAHSASQASALSSSSSTLYPKTTQLSHPDIVSQEGVNSAQQSSGLLAQALVYQPAVNLDKLHHHLGEPHLRSLFHSQRGNKCDRRLWYDDIRNVDAAAAGAANTAAASPDDA